MSYQDMWEVITKIGNIILLIISGVIVANIVFFDTEMAPVQQINQMVFAIYFLILSRGD